MVFSRLVLLKLESRAIVMYGAMTSQFMKKIIATGRDKTSVGVLACPGKIK